jgi:hypothetical protein
MLDSSAKRIRLFVDLDWPSGWVYVHSGIGDRTYNGNTYKGIGELGQIGQITEDGKLSAARLSLTLTLLDPAMVNDVIANDPTGRRCRVNIVRLDDNNRIAEGDLLFDGDIADINITKGNPAKVTLTVSDWFEQWARPVENAKWTDASQKAKYQNDDFFNMADEIADRPLNSGTPGSTIGGGGGMDDNIRYRMR